MVSWSGRKKALTIIAFIAPTLIGIVMFNIYPILFNVYISFTNRNQYHPNPNCEDTLSGIFEPSCWPMFKESSGVSQPYRLQDPVFQNYADLIGQLFTGPGMIAIGKFVLVFIPLILAIQVNKYYDKRITRPVSSFVVWLGALVLAVLIAWLVDAPGAMNTLQATSDFFVVVFRTLLFVVITVPINYIFGLVLALVLNSNYHQRTDILPSGDGHPLGCLDHVHHHVPGLAVLLPRAGYGQPDSEDLQYRKHFLSHQPDLGFCDHHPGQPVVLLPLLLQHHPGRVAVHFR